MDRKGQGSKADPRISQLPSWQVSSSGYLGWTEVASGVRSSNLVELHIGRL